RIVRTLLGNERCVDGRAIQTEVQVRPIVVAPLSELLLGRCESAEQHQRESNCEVAKPFHASILASIQQSVYSTSVILSSVTPPDYFSYWRAFRQASLTQSSLQVTA